MTEENRNPFDGKTAAECINYYLKARETKAALAAKVKEVDEIIAHLDQALLNILDAQGVDSTKVRGAGSVSKTIKKQYACEDWNEFYGWLLNRAKELEAAGESPVQVFSFLQKRVSSTELDDYRERFDAGLPPSMKMNQQYAISVRKDS